MNEYHQRQYETIYDSTTRLLHVLNQLTPSDSSSRDQAWVVDFGSGGGAVTRNISEIYPQLKVLGLERDFELIEFAKKMNSTVSNLEFQQEDFLNFTWKETRPPFLITAIQTVSWVEGEDIYAPMRALLKHEAAYVVATLLTFAGKVDCKVTINDFSGVPWSSPYNILSKVKIIEIAAEFGYDVVQCDDLKAPRALRPRGQQGMGSFTRLVDGELLTFSGPLLLPWTLYVFQKNGGG